MWDFCLLLLTLYAQEFVLRIEVFLQNTSINFYHLFRNSLLPSWTLWLFLVTYFSFCCFESAGFWLFFFFLFFFKMGKILTQLSSCHMTHDFSHYICVCVALPFIWNVFSPAVVRCPFLSCTGSSQNMWGEQRMPLLQCPTTAYT